MVGNYEFANSILTFIIDPDAILLVEELDGLPLALATAGAYLKQINTSFAVYLQQYKESWKKLQETSPQISSYEDRTLYSTWQISFDRVEQQNELSAKLLRHPATKRKGHSVIQRKGWVRDRLLVGI